MLDPTESGVTMTSSHKISFSIIDILDPKKFNSKRANELSTVAEKFPVPNAEDSSTAEGDFRAVYAETGEKWGNFEVFIRIYTPSTLLRRSNLLQMRISKEYVDLKKKSHSHTFYKKNTLKS